VILKDAFGNRYEVDLLPLDKLEEKFFEKSLEDIIRMAWNSYVPGLKDGVVFFDLTTGLFIPVGLTTGEGLIRQAHLAKVYDIPKNYESTWFSASPEDFFYPEDFDRLREILLDEGIIEDEVDNVIDEMDIEEIAEKLDLTDEEYEERMITYLENFTDLGELWEEVVREYNKLVSLYQ
jgi:hypothetical protein